MLLASAAAAVRAADIILVWTREGRWLRGEAELTIRQTQESGYSQQCSGMYSRKSWGGKVEPFIMVKFIETDKPQPVPDPTVAVVIWEWQDSDLLGMPPERPLDEVRSYGLVVLGMRWARLTPVNSANGSVTTRPWH